MNVSSKKYMLLIENLWNIYEPWYSWNTAKIGIKPQYINQLIEIFVRINHWSIMFHWIEIQQRNYLLMADILIKWENKLFFFSFSFLNGSEKQHHG